MTDQENITDFDFPAKFFAELWCKEDAMAPEFRLLKLTHHRNPETGKYGSRLAYEIS